MNITSLTLWHLPLTSHIAYNMSDGKICDTVTSCILRLESDTGLTGWGEVCPIPHYLPAYANGVAPALTELAPVIFARDGLALGAEGMIRAANMYLQGHEYAKSPLDLALWDLTARAAGLPLHAFLGGLQSARLPIYHSISCLAPDEMARIAAEETGRGITQIQVKLGADRDNEADIARLRKVREAVPSGTLVYGDWNCGASRLDATRVGRAVADLDIMLEQPCTTLEECAAVRDAFSRNGGSSVQLPPPFADRFPPSPCVSSSVTCSTVALPMRGGVAGGSSATAMEAAGPVRVVRPRSLTAAQSSSSSCVALGVRVVVCW